MTTGKAYLDMRQALEDLGIDEARARALGIRLYKVGMTWPLEPEGARRFAEGLQEVLVVEEKRSNLEDQLVRILYNAPADRRPLVVGKTDETGRIILPSDGELTPTGVAMVIAGRLMKHRRRIAGAARSAWPASRAKEKLLAAPPPKVARTPYFCSGCPHNTSTRVPEGSRGDGRHRLPRHGDLDAERRTDADHPHGRRRRRPGSARRRSAPTSTSSRTWATAPITIRGLTGDPPGRAPPASTSPTRSCSTTPSP